MYRIFMFLIFSFLSIKCQPKKECFCERKNDVLQKNDSMLSSIQEDSSHYRKQKKCFKEIPMFNAVHEFYSFSYSNYFSIYEPNIFYKVEKEYLKKPVFSYKLHQKYIHETYNGVDTVFLKKDSTIEYSKEISDESWQQIVNAFDQNCFWVMPCVLKEDSFCFVSRYLEAYRPEGNGCTNNLYHGVSRCSIDSSGFTSIYPLFERLID